MLIYFSVTVRLLIKPDPYSKSVIMTALYKAEKDFCTVLSFCEKHFQTAIMFVINNDIAPLIIISFLI